MKKLTGFAAGLFLIVGIGAASGFAQQDTMKQSDTMSKKGDSMMMSSKKKTTKRRAVRKHSRRKMMAKKPAVK